MDWMEGGSMNCQICMNKKIPTDKRKVPQV